MCSGVGCGDCGLVAVCFSPQIRNYAPNMIQKRKESASLVKGGSIIENIPPKGEIFSDFIATFTMSGGFDTYFICNTKIGEKSDKAKSRATFCCSGT